MGLAKEQLIEDRAKTRKEKLLEKKKENTIAKLSPLKLTPKSEPFQVLDIETMNWTKFIVLGFFDGMIYKEFRQRSQFAQFVKSIPFDLNCFAHFGGKFDFLFLLKEFAQHDDLEIINIIPRGSSILSFQLNVYHKKEIIRTHIFKDSSALLPFSLKSLTENFNTQTKKGEWDHEKTQGYSKDLSEYLESDCRGLFDVLTKFYNQPIIKRAGPAWTTASQAIRVLRCYIPRDIYSMSEHFSEYARQAYLGGRTEIFRTHLKSGKLYEFDVNSLYPFVMKSNLFPIGNAVRIYGEMKKDKLGIYFAEVIAPKIHVPCLGIIQNKKYIFPIGKFQGHWTSAEINYAKSLGYKIKIIDGIYFDESLDIFSEFITELYKIRQASTKNSVDDIVAKLLMNSSYGRFGMNPLKQNMTFEIELGVREHTELKIKNKTVQLFEKDIILKSFTHVGIAAFVTSYARIHMHKIMHKIPPKDLYYTDTDSIFTTKKLPTSTDLGALKLEKIYDSAVFLLPKTYFAKGAINKIAMKGFDKKKIQNFTLEDFQMALQGDLSRLKIHNKPKFASFKTALAKKKIVTMTKASSKKLNATYSKRLILNTGMTMPITMGE